MNLCIEIIPIYLQLIMTEKSVYDIIKPILQTKGYFMQRK